MRDFAFFELLLRLGRQARFLYALLRAVKFKIGLNTQTHVALTFEY